MLEQLTFVWNSLLPLLKGTVVTIELTLGLLAIGLVMGLFLAFGQVYGHRYRLMVPAISGFDRTFRAIPALVLIFLFFFGSPFFGIELAAFTSALLALGFRSAAYQSQIFRGAIQSISANQMMAARSIGMSKLKAILYIILPQALRLAIPPWSNEYAVVLKDTSLAFGIGVAELFRQGRYIIAREPRQIMTILFTVAAIYFVLTYLGNKLLGILEGRLRVPGFEAKKAGPLRREML